MWHQAMSDVHKCVSWLHSRSPGLNLILDDFGTNLGGSLIMMTCWTAIVVQVLITVGHWLRFRPGQLVLDWGSGCGHKLLGLGIVGEL